MIKLKDLLLTENTQIKWIVGYIDGYDKVHYKVVKHGDPRDSHNTIWNVPLMKKWRWMPSKPIEINAYGNSFDEEDSERVWNTIDRYL